MSGHSKWHNIQARKGKQDAKRGNVFSKYSQLITVAAKSGGGDTETNFSLRLAIEKARSAGVPKDNIERAIKAGIGELKGNQIEEQLYECYGPGGVAILIKTVTDNKNRTVSEIKHLLAQNGGSMGGSGSVLWMFQQFGVIEIKNQSAPPAGGWRTKIKNRDEFELSLIDAGVEDFEENEGDLVIRTKVENLQKVLHKLKAMGIATDESRLEWVAKDKVKIATEVEEKLDKLLEDLSDHDDVDDFFTNAE